MRQNIDECRCNSFLNENVPFREVRVKRTSFCGCHVRYFEVEYESMKVTAPRLKVKDSFLDRDGTRERGVIKGNIFHIILFYRK